MAKVIMDCSAFSLVSMILPILVNVASGNPIARFN
jgi:hypothetical protein